MPLTRTHLQPGAEGACRPLRLTVQETPCVDVAPLMDLGSVPVKPPGRDSQPDATRNPPGKRPQGQHRWEFGSRRVPPSWVTLRASVEEARGLEFRVEPELGTELLPSPGTCGVCCRIGTAALAVQVVGSNWPKPHYTLLVTGLCRFQIVQVLKEKPYPVAQVEQLDRLEEFPSALQAREELGELSEQFYKYAVQLVEMLDMSVPAVAKLRRLLDSLPREALPDILTSIIRTSNKEKLQILDAVSLEDRFKATIPLLVRQIEGLKLLQKTRKHTQDDEKRVGALGARFQGPVFLGPEVPRGGWGGLHYHTGHSMKGGPAAGGLQRLVDGGGRAGVRGRGSEASPAGPAGARSCKVRTSSMPEPARRVCLKEVKRLKKMPQSMPEYALTRNYLELMVELPWNKSTTDRLDIRAARVLLDNDHYAMEKLKKRVLEYLAVRQLKNNLKGPILCFVGPPGVGKTSVGRSVAKTLGREFHRIALGGVCDQSDIRGHRWVSPHPPVPLLSLGWRDSPEHSAGSLSPRKGCLDSRLRHSLGLGHSLQGDPAAALLEVLDPEQNHNFTDHYLNVAFDLSQVLFIATANTTATIPAALLDRMEVIQVPGYTQEEKIEIAHRHLIPKQLDQHGLTPQQLQIPPATTLGIITRYTREAGVRSLDRKLGAICRAVAVKVAEGPHREAKLERADTMEAEGVWPSAVSGCGGVLGCPREGLRRGLSFTDGTASASSAPHAGSWSLTLCPAPRGMLYFADPTGKREAPTSSNSLGGECRDPARYRHRLTGGDSRDRPAPGRRESSGSFDLLDNTDIHLHFPAGAVTKDGPSAGVTIVTCLASLFSGRLVRSDVAMTGEITLRGLVLPVGGIKDKVLAAHRAGLKRVILPQRNEKDLEEIPGNVRRDLSFVTASCLDEVLNAAFDGGFSVKARPGLLNSKL
ncbi:PREDICTED: lon protease homolog 2, peroxisomal [Myotis davidii]|uniref:lon protease homolog 2, peroxisomal n=1 Tax=Myotis davidii TaxID=225400 RepID=UPI000767859C|nr:PREDICTED: lon protease homolog 2, peroxisomal [Myotis davidii]